MPIQFACSCGRKLQAREEQAGRRVKCPACGAETTVPEPDDAVQTAEPPKPKMSPVTAAESRRPAEDDRDDDRPRRRRSRDDDEDEDDRPRRRRSRDDDEDEDDEDRVRAPSRTSSKATAALVLGLLSLCAGFLASIPAIILAILSFGEISRGRGRVRGKGIAIAGLVLGCVGLVLPVVLTVFAVHKVREAASRMTVQNNLKEMSQAMITDATVLRGQMMAPAICDKKGKPLLSWRVHLLLQVGADNLYRQFKMDEPWDSPHNFALIERMPKVYAHPSDPDANARGYTHYRVFTGPQTPFQDAIAPFETRRSKLRYPAGFTDGTSNTILIVEAAEAVPWTKPDELPYDPNKPLPKLGGLYRGGFMVALADGSTRLVSANVSDQTLRAAITPAGNDLLGADW